MEVEDELRSLRFEQEAELRANDPEAFRAEPLNALGNGLTAIALHPEYRAECRRNPLRNHISAGDLATPSCPAFPEQDRTSK